MSFALGFFSGSLTVLVLLICFVVYVVRKLS